MTTLDAGLPYPGIWPLCHSLAFDVSVWEIWGALLRGGRLVVVSETVAGSPQDFHELLVAEQVTMLTQTPSAVAMLPSEGLESTALAVVGEACPATVVDRWAPGRTMINAYGPTETTMCVAISAPLRAGIRWSRSALRCRGRRCSSWTPGCSRYRQGLSVSSMWPVTVWHRATSGART